MRIKEALIAGKAFLADSSDSPGLDAALLLAKTLKTRREDLVLRGDETVGKAEEEEFNGLLKRRKSGECVAYILGQKEFRGLNFIVNPNVLVPRPETEILVEAALEYIDSAIDKGRESITAKDGGGQLSILDLCTGSGAIAISLKNERPYLAVTASDISPAALNVAKKNAAKLLPAPETRAGKHYVSFIQSDLFKSIRARFNIILSNPPYVRTGDLSALSPEVRREPELALNGGEDGLKVIKKIISQGPDHLLPGGRLFIEAAPGQMQAIRYLLSEHAYIGIGVYKDLSDRERVISAGLK